MTETAAHSSPPLTGGCLCGAVRYELDAPIKLLINCHCRFCRRAHGAAFVTSSPVSSKALRIVAGEDDLTRCEGRFFCCQCAGRLFNRADAFPDITALIVASLDREPALKPSMHMNVESKSPWYEIRDDAPQFDAFPDSVSREFSNSD